MKKKIIKILYRLFAFLSDRTGGFKLFVKYKLILGALLVVSVPMTTSCEFEFTECYDVVGTEGIEEPTCYDIADTTQVEEPVMIDTTQVVPPADTINIDSTSLENNENTRH